VTSSRSRSGGAIRMRRARTHRSRRPSDGEPAFGDVDRGPHPGSPNLSGRLLWNWPAWAADQKWLSATEDLMSAKEGNAAEKTFKHGNVHWIRDATVERLGTPPTWTPERREVCQRSLDDNLLAGGAAMQVMESRTL
jgi:hypothetical protein